MFVKIVPPSVLTCHWTVGLPLAEAMNETELPAHAAAFVGFALIAGVELTVTVALLVPVLAQPFASLTLVTL
jgi:hypothetical protein